MAARDCMTRAWALAIATAACVGLPAALVYVVVGVASAHRLGVTISLAAFLAVWVAVSAAYYPRAFADILRWFALSRYLRGGHRGSRAQRHTTTTTTTRRRRRALLPRFVALGQRTSEQRQGSNNGALVPPPFVVARRSWQEEEEEGHGGDDMGALSREPPAAAWRRDGGEACKMQRCVVCLCDVEKVETAAWLPACMHVFHRHCIERWLHDHSTCPICRALVAAVQSETL